MIQIIPSKVGAPTVRIEKNKQTFYLHSQYDPIREAERLVQNWNVHKSGILIIYGLGCGHHIRALLKTLDTKIKIIVLEGCKDLVEMVKSKGIIHDLLLDPRFQLVVMDNNAEFSNILNKYIDLVQNDDASFVIHGPSLKAIPDHMQEIRKVLEEYQVQVVSASSQSEKLQANLQKVWQYLYKYPNVGNAFRSFEKIPSIIVSAGPSLDSVLPTLAKLQDKALILCVGTAFKALKRFGIRPHFVVAIEPQEAVLKQFAEIEQDIPLIAFPTASPNLTLSYKGPVIWAFPQDVKELKDEAEKNQIPTVKSGGSVATATLSIAGLLGCSPIIFVGQDLAYLNGRTHATGTIYDGQLQPVLSSAYIRQTVAVGGGQIATSLSWDLFRKWIERYIAENPSTQYYNCSYGARIKGTEEVSLEKLMNSGYFHKKLKIFKKIREIFNT